MSTLVELIQSRRTVQSFTTEKVPSEILKKAVELGSYAPNHKLTHPWRFFLANESLRNDLAEIQVELKAAKSGPLSEAAANALRKKIKEEGALIIAGVKKNSDPTREKEDYASLACALQNMALYLWSEGYGSKWGSGKVIHHPKVYEALGESKDNFSVEAFFWVGKAAAPTRDLVPDRKKLLETIYTVLPG